ncbi:MAG: endonuclease/exonuclease/phosphatase family protein [Ahniella sp.]|nr:endonuclease/exonuclease/phosphatase family protein [Ahniella sp.]
MTEIFLPSTGATSRTRRHILIRFGALLATFAMATMAHAQQLDRPDGTEFRYLTWNVARENFVDQSAAIRQVLNVLDADVILFDELPEPVTEESLAAFAASLDHGPYLSVLGKGGGSYQRSAVLARTPLTRVDSFDVLKYPTDAANRWLNGVGRMREVLGPESRPRHSHCRRGYPDGSGHADGGGRGPSMLRQQRRRMGGRPSSCGGQGHPLGSRCALATTGSSDRFR